MNKRYIDFVPAKKSQAVGQRGAVVRTRVVPKAETGVTVVRRTTVTRTVAPKKVVGSRTVESPKLAEPVMVSPAEKKMPTVGMSVAEMPALGVVEDLNRHFVKTDVPKRPLSATLEAKKTQGIDASGTNNAKEAKAKRVKARALTKKARSDKTVEKPAQKKSAVSEKATFKTPKSPFINQSKVVKRPLSGNIYRKEIVKAVKEEPKGPVTIIAKPEKDRHIGIVVTIIITIILGAAAGTVAFLLLPK